MLREVIKDDPSPYVKYIEYIEEDKILGIPKIFPYLWSAWNR